VPDDGAVDDYVVDGYVPAVLNRAACDFSAGKTGGGPLDGVILCLSFLYRFVVFGSVNTVQLPVGRASVPAVWIAGRDARATIPAPARALRREH